MRRSTKLVASLIFPLVAGGAAYSLVAKSDEAARAQEFRDLVAITQSDHPQRGLAYDWLDCLERQRDDAKGAAARVVCKTWTAQGLTSELIALTIGDQHVPVIESRLEGAENVRVVVDITGGPGGEPFYVKPAITEGSLTEMRRLGAKDTGVEGPSVYFRFIEKGFTVASIGYWGTSFRTLNAAGEVELAVSDVRASIDFYRDEAGAEPALIMTSLGNHLALGALGKDRLEEMDFLALVPIMDGLQHHLGRVTQEIDRQRLEAEAAGEPFGKWTFFNIYRQTERGIDFDHVQMLPMYDFVPRFVGAADFAWSGVAPSNRCSKIVLGDEDPRTLQYLATNKGLPSFISVLEADHDVFEDAPSELHEIFEKYATCLIEQSS